MSTDLPEFALDAQQRLALAAQLRVAFAYHRFSVRALQGCCDSGLRRNTRSNRALTLTA